MAWLNVVYFPLNLSTQIARPAGAAELTRLLQSSQALKPNCSQGWMVLRGVNGWRSLTVSTFTNIARPGHEKPIYSTLDCRNCFDTLDAQHCCLHPVLTFQLFRHA